MKNQRLVNTLLVSLVSLSALSQALGRPRLVVGITVDQLRTDPLEQLRSMFGDKGFRRLLEGGVYIKNLDFGQTAPDIASGTARLLTGATPGVNGISSKNAYDITTRSAKPTLAPQGSYTPQPLLLSTISDELAIDGIGLSAIYSIAANPEIAVIAGGHAANAAIWIDPHNGRWTTSGYYKETPRAMNVRNTRLPLSSRIDTMQWKPLLPLDKYTGVPAQKRFYPFRHTFPSSRKDCYEMLARSPQGNREVTDFAIDLLVSEQLGNRGDAVDMLNIGYSMAPCKEIADGDYRLEQQDSYLRLDKDLERLFEAIDSQVGMQNVVVWMLPTGYYDDGVEVDEKYRLPTGTFSMKKALSLLNSYLGAKYGNAEWVAGAHDRDIYLNARTLENAIGHSEGEILADARDFIMKMSGVAEAVTLPEILSGTTPELIAMRKDTDASKAGHLRIKVQPGWKHVDDTQNPSKTVAVRLSAALTPALILVPGIEKEEITQAVEAVEIAPTLTRMLRIRAPNGASAKGLLLKGTPLK